MKNEIKLFQDKKIRSAWVEESEEWFFSIEDVVEALTDSADPKQYIKKMRSRDEMLASNWGTICTQVRMTASDGKQRKISAADTKGIFRIIQSIPSPKAEPFKMWLAEVGKERLDEIADPELAVERMKETYRRKGYSEKWINQRMKSIDVRNELTEEWDRVGVQGNEYAILTDEITRAWSGMTTRQYKNYKGLTKEGLRDNMTNMELILNMLAEASTTEISRAEDPVTLEESKAVAKRGGSVANNARRELEQQTGKKVISKLNAKGLAKPDVKELEE